MFNTFLTVDWTYNRASIDRFVYEYF